jgi:arylsulfatase A-like enzyme
MTGLYSLESGMWRGTSNPGHEPGPRPREIKTRIRMLPEYLKEAGYATGIFGKWHLGYETPNTPNQRGFDEFFGFLSGAHPYRATARNPFLLNGFPLSTSEHSTDLFTDRAISFMRRTRGRPFFCYVPYNSVHGPLWTEDAPKPSGKPDWLAAYANKGVDFPRRDYNAVLGHMDARIGDLLLTLDELGVADNTLVIFLSDNGAIIDKYPGNNGPLRGAKGQTYEGGIRVPAVVRWPGVIPAGAVSDAYAMHFDVFATILEAARVEAPRSNGGYPMRGQSLLAHLISGGQTPLAERIVLWDLFGKVAAAKGPWKLVGETPNHHGDFAKAAENIRDTEFELYNVESDLGETNNLASKQPEIYNELHSALLAWMLQTEASY